MLSATASSSLPRVPVVSDEIAKKHNVYFALDQRFRRAARLLQCLWLRDRGIPTGHRTRGEGDDAVTMELHSSLSRDAARAGLNFMSPETHAFVRRELAMCELGAAYDQERLFGNALSSQPMSMNLFAPMALDRSLATAVFKRLLPDFVHEVAGFRFEHSPSRERKPGEWLEDGTAFDLAVKVITPQGEEGTVFIETKYSESLDSNPARIRPRYDEVSRSSGLFIDADSPMLRTLALEQLWRLHMLSQVIVDKGLTSRAVFIAIGPRLNHRVMAAFRSYKSELIADDDRDANRVPFQAFTLETVIDTLGDAGAADLARQLWARYCDFERVFNIALQEFIDAPPAPPQPAIPSKKPASLNVPSSFQKKGNSDATLSPCPKKRTASRSRTKSKVTA